MVQGDEHAKRRTDEHEDPQCLICIYTKMQKRAKNTFDSPTCKSLKNSFLFWDYRRNKKSIGEKY